MVLVVYTIAEAAQSDPGKDCEDPRDKCRELLRETYATTNEIHKRTADLVNDPQGLFTRAFNKPIAGQEKLGTWLGHQHQLEGWKNRLRALIRKLRAAKCPVPPQAMEAAYSLIPLNPAGR